MHLEENKIRVFFFDIKKKKENGRPLNDEVGKKNSLLTGNIITDSKPSNRQSRKQTRR